MMSVLIRGMKMPKDCRECLMQVYYSSGKTWCKPADRLLADDYKPIIYDDRPDWCPLVEVPEPHRVMEKLKPCPFCGNEVEVEKFPLWHGNGRGYKDCYEFKIRCKKCGCRVDQPENDSVYRSEEKARKNAIEAWNRRVSDDK